MNRYLQLFLFTVLFSYHLCLCAQDTPATKVDKDRITSLWKGFKRYDFTFQDRGARVVVPNKPRAGNPWIWRARFPDWHTETDSILVAEGFHLAFIDTQNTYGSPNAVSLWDDFYAFLITNYKLQKKVALMGVSRGGLLVYNWAKKNPEKLSCIYAEAPVCDFKSWPAGFGKSNGNQEDWDRLKNEYEFGSDAEAKAYANNPIDGLEALAEAKIPILHMIGIKDKIVPIAENTMPLITTYIQLGGNATVLTSTKGSQKLKGHHFPVETPRSVADFITYHSHSQQPLHASDYHNAGSGLKNSLLKFEGTKKGRVAFLGGSITHNSGWRDSISGYLIKRFPETKFEFIAAGIPSMGSTPAAFRLERDVLSHGKIDLLFEEAAVNDASNGRSQKEQIRAMEGIIRQLRKSNAEIDIVMMHFVDPDKIKSYKKEIEPAVILNHNKIATHYTIPTINLAKEVSDRIHNSEFTWNDDFKNLHPSPFGQGVYAHSMVQFLNNAYSSHIDPDDKIMAYSMPDKLDTYAYDGGSLIDVSAAKFDKKWSINQWKPKDGASTRPNYADVPMLTATVPGSAMKLKFEGPLVGIAVAAGPDAGIIEYRVDKKEWKTLDLFTKWSSHLHLPWYYTLEAELEDKSHILELRIIERRNERSTGNACRIRYFYTNTP